jgi:hypothetical protein
MAIPDERLEELYAQARERRAGLKRYTYDCDEEPDIASETTWYIPYTHGGSPFELEVHECRGQFGLNWCHTDDIVEEILGLRTGDAAGMSKWEHERSLSLFAQYPNIPRDVWRKTRPADMNVEWKDFWHIHKEHMETCEEYKQNKPPYRNFWHHVLKAPFKHFRRDNFNTYPIEYYSPEHLIWKRYKAFHPILELHKDLAYHVAQLFPEIQKSGEYVKTSINYWVYW